MTDPTIRCPVRAATNADGRWAKHAPTYDNGALQATDGGLRSVCRDCGAAISRRNRNSTWWHAEASLTPAIETPGDDVDPASSMRADSRCIPLTASAVTTCAARRDGAP